MTDKELRDLTVEQHAGKANKFNVEFSHLKKLRDKKLEVASKEEKPKTGQEAADRGRAETSKMSEGEFRWYGRDEKAYRLTREENSAAYD